MSSRTVVPLYLPRDGEELDEVSFNALMAEGRELERQKEMELIARHQGISSRKATTTTIHEGGRGEEEGDENDGSSVESKGRASVKILAPLLLMQMAGNGVTLVWLPSLLVSFFSKGEDCVTNTSNFLCRDAHAKSVTSLSIVAFVSNFLLQFPLSPVIGRLSDLTGRLPLIRLASFIAVLPAAALMGATCFGLSLYLYFPALALMGATCSPALYMAYVADASREKSVHGFAMMAATISLSLTIAPLLGASLFGAETASQIGLLLLLLAFAYSFLILPESLPPSQRDHSVFPTPKLIVVDIRNMVSVIWSDKTRFRIVVAIMLASACLSGMEDLLLQYFRLKLDFVPLDNGYLFLVMGACSFVSLLILLRPLASLLGNHNTFLLGLFFILIQNLLLAFTTTKLMALITIAVGSIGTIGLPTSYALMAQTSDENGVLMGAVRGAECVALGIGPLLFAGLFEYFHSSFSGAPFLFGALLMLVAILITKAAEGPQRHGHILLPVSSPYGTPRQLEEEEEGKICLP